MSGCFMFNRTLFCVILGCWLKVLKYVTSTAKKKKKNRVVFHPWTALLHQVRSRGFSQRLPDCRPKEASKGRERCCLYSGLSAIHIFSLFSPHSLVLFIFVLKCTIKQTLTAIWLRRSDCVLIHAEWEKKAHYINFNQTDIVDRNSFLWCVFLY